MLLLGIILLAPSGALTSPMPLNSTLSKEVSAYSQPDLRNPYSIAFTCISTTFVCAWTSVHPNIPPTDMSWWARKKLRIELLFWAIVAPELILSWAMCQWMGARRLAQEYKDEGWTMTYSFCLTMGGFCYAQEDGTQHVLTYEHAKDRSGNIIISDRVVFQSMKPSHVQQITKMVSEKEIQDKSKSDFLSKFITALQTTWFIVQCIARRVQGVPITELELTTIAIAMLNVFMMFFWWNKPIDVEVPMLLHGGWNSGQKDTTSSSMHEELLCDEPVGVEGQQIRGKSEDDGPGRQSFEKWLWITGPLAPAAQILSQNPNGIPQSDNRFTTITLNTKEQLARSALLMIIAPVFGGLHLVAWTFAFPSRSAAVCWKTAALVIAAGPCALVVMIVVVYTLEALLNGNSNRRSTLSSMALASFYILIPCSYIAARLTLLVEALVLLAYIPPDGLKQIDWLRFIPHL